LAGADASPEEIRFIREKYGLDRPILIQYFEWVGRALRGNFGESPYFNQPVEDIIGDRLGVTLTLGCCAFAFAICLAIPLGIIAAIRPNTWIDRTALTISVFGQALPNFFFGLVMIIFFGVTLRWLPISGDDTWKHFIMPAIALGYYASPALMRLTRTGMLEVLASDYIRTAKAKGLKAGRVLFKHALRNAIIPVVSLAFVLFGYMLGGAFIIEYVFAINGIGFLAVRSIQRADLPVVQSIVLLLAVIYVFMTLVADIINAYLDPRIRAK
jgi:peptide/nickel transport system permease protein